MVPHLALEPNIKVLMCQDCWVAGSHFIDLSCCSHMRKLTWWLQQTLENQRAFSGQQRKNTMQISLGLEKISWIYHNKPGNSAFQLAYHWIESQLSHGNFFSSVYQLIYLQSCEIDCMRHTMKTAFFCITLKVFGSTLSFETFWHSLSIRCIITVDCNDLDSNQPRNCT